MVFKKNVNSQVAFQSIHQPSVVEQIIETFKQSIIHGDLRPGQRLPSELELSRQLGVGRSAVRESMKVLQALGVITIRQGDGTYIVDSASPKMLSPLVFAVMLEAGMTIELFELRVLIEIGYCELAAEKATLEDWQLMEQAAKDLEDYVATGERDIDTLIRLDLAFHSSVLEATHNPLVIRIGCTVEELFFVPMRDTYIARTDNVQWAIKSHREILDVLHDGSPTAIRKVIEDSLVYWKEEVKKLGERNKAQDE
jgi:GntR family transcriptional regulator, transcriptional repressor for pyruvate dehydrogenase complex